MMAFRFRRFGFRRAFSGFRSRWVAFRPRFRRFFGPFGGVGLMLGVALGAFAFGRLRNIRRGVLVAGALALLMRKTRMLRGFGGFLKGFNIGLAAAVLLGKATGSSSLRYSSYELPSGGSEAEQVKAVLAAAGYPRFPEAARLIEAKFGPGASQKYNQLILDTILRKTISA